MNKVPRPGTPAFFDAIDRAASVEAIDELRDALDYSQAEFARKAGVNETWYSRAKREGRKPQPRTIRNLRDGLRRLALERAGSDNVVPLRA